MTASSPAQFYLIELLKLAVPVAGIGFILVVAARRHRVARSQASRWLVIITALWLLITLADRFALSAPARKHFISVAMSQYAESHRESFYFAIMEGLWTAEQIMILVFGITLFFAFRDDARHI